MYPPKSLHLINSVWNDMILSLPSRKNCLHISYLFLIKIKENYVVIMLNKALILMVFPFCGLVTNAFYLKIRFNYILMY